nr:hypothetical protein OG409_02830 [Streptomyces sp. NBC_00974]
MPTWDEVAPIFLPKTDSVKTRNDVAGPGSPTWLSGHANLYVSNYSTANIKSLAAGKDARYDFFKLLTPLDPALKWGVLVGGRMNWTMFNDSTANYNTYRTGVWALLDDLVNKAGVNETVNHKTFEQASVALLGVCDLLSTTLGKDAGILQWIDELGDTGDNWRGSAAGEFKKYLSTIALALTHIQTDLQHPDNFYAQLSDAASMLKLASSELLKAQLAWFGTRQSGATEVLQDALNAQLTGTITMTTAGKVTVNGADVDGGDFWENVQQAAKKAWLAGLSAPLQVPFKGVVGTYSLDTLAHAVYTLLDNEYNRLGSAFGRGVIQPNLGLPQGAGGGGPVPEPGPGGADAPPGGGTGDQKIPPPGGNLKVDGGNNQTGGNKGGPKPGGPVPKPGDLIPKPGAPVPGNRDPITGLPLPGTANLLDKNGKPVLDKDKKPVIVPAGSVIGKDGKVRDSKGNLVLGTDGKPIVAPPGSKIKEQAPPHPAPSLLDQIKLPEGSKVNPDGVLVDANGKPLLDSNGNPYALPKGASVNHDGVLVDAKGRPVDRMSQLLANTEHALLDSRTSPRPGTSSSLLPDGRGPLGLSLGGSHSGLGSVSGLGSGAGSGSGAGGGKGSGATSLIAGPTMLSDRAMAMTNSSAPPGTEADRAKAAEEAAKQLAAQQQTQSGPMMPPMGGAGAGAGAGAGGQKDRQRTTWLSEDEDTWGTDTGTVSGVIGR